MGVDQRGVVEFEFLSARGWSSSRWPVSTAS